MKKAINVQIVALFLVLLPLCNAISAEIQPNDNRCVNEFVKERKSLMLEYSEGFPVRVEIKDPAGKLIVEKTWDVPTKWAQDVTTPGFYEFCFFNSQRVTVFATFDFVTGLAAKDFSQAATKTQLKPMEENLSRMEEKVTSLKANLEDWRQKREAHNLLTEQIDNSAMTGTVGSVVLLFAVAIGQVVYLRNFFRSKQIID